MAAGPTVTLTFAGDSSKLSSAFNDVGSAADGMASDVGKASDKVRSSGSGFDAAGEAADGAEGKFRGVADTLTGFSDVATGFKNGDVLSIVTGFADLGGGAAALLPMIGGLGATIRTGLGGAMSFIAAHPMMLVLAGLVALLATLWFASEDFRNAVIRLGQAAWTWIKEKFGAAWDWVKSKAISFWDWISGLPGRVSRTFRNIVSGIKNAFRAGFNWVARAWNSTVGRIGFSVPSWVPGIGGASFSVPDIPYFHRGGIVPGAPGTETLAMLQAGERVTPAGRVRGEQMTVTFRGDTDAAFASAFMKLVRTGKIQIKAG